MEKFIEYLKGKGYSPKSMDSYVHSTEKLLYWLRQKHTLPQYTTYNKLLDYVKYLKKKGDSSGYINGQLNGIKHYFDHLQCTDLVPDNPAMGLYIKGVHRRLPHGILTGEQLLKIYRECPGKYPGDRYLVGLMVFQGLRQRELARLQSQDFDLKEMRVFVTGDKRTASRYIPLDKHQLSHLEAYFKGHDQLLGKSIKYHVNRLTPYLNGHVDSLRQLRASVITNWLKGHNLREVQYLAGHKYISTTEKYQRVRPEALQKAVEMYHPLGANKKEKEGGEWEM